MTIVDRDFGDGVATWQERLGFAPVQQMPPLTFLVGPDGYRYHIIGERGRTSSRRFLPTSILDELTALGAEPRRQQVLSALARRRFFPVYDAGMLRLCLILEGGGSSHCAHKGLAIPERNALVRGVWETSSPRYAEAYYASLTALESLLVTGSEGR